MRPLRICIDARLIGGESGGIEQFIIGLASGLSKLDDGPEEYYFLVRPDSKGWILPYIMGTCKILEDAPKQKESVSKLVVNHFFHNLANLWHIFNYLVLGKLKPQPKSNETIEKAGINVMHFTRQAAFITKIPSIYHPHDLQHIHLPELFTFRDRWYREHAYRTFCGQAKIVAVAFDFVKQDLIEHFQLAEEKIKVVPLAPVVNIYSEFNQEDQIDLRNKYSLPSEFIFYPAQTWPHKNHLGLLQALIILRDHMNIKIPVVFSGKKEKFYKTIEKDIKKLDLVDQVIVLGFVTPIELRGIYNLCRAVVIPTKFEAGSFPLWEAFIMGKPAACSNVTSLPEQAGDAALLFDPDKPQEIARCIHNLWVDEKLRSELVERGKQRVSLYSWERTARIFRAHYRRLAEYPLDDGDKELLNVVTS